MQIVLRKDVRRLGLEAREGVEVAPRVRDAELRRGHVLLGLGLIGEGALHVELGAGAALLAVAGETQVVLRDLEVLCRPRAAPPRRRAASSSREGRSSPRSARRSSSSARAPASVAFAAALRSQLAMLMSGTVRVTLASSWFCGWMTMVGTVAPPGAASRGEERRGRHLELVSRVAPCRSEVRQEGAGRDPNLGVALGRRRVGRTVLGIPRPRVLEELGHRLKGERRARRDGAGGERRAPHRSCGRGDEGGTCWARPYRNF